METERARRMRILMVLKNTNMMDGVNRHVLAIAPALNQMAGNEIAVSIEWPRGELNDALENAGVRTYSLNVPNGHSVRAFTRFVRILREFRPDVVHLHEGGFFVSLALKVCPGKRRIVSTCHAISDPVEKVTMRMRIEHFLSRFTRLPVSAVCCISEGVKASMGPVSVPQPVIYNPIDFEAVPSGADLRQLLNLPHDTKMVGTACRIALVKNPAAFTRVMCQVLHELPEAHAVVIGSGVPELEAEAKRIVEECGMISRFHWLGSRNDARKLIADLDCFVMTSHREGLPTAVLEAFAGRTPVALFDGEGGLHDIAEMNRKEGPFAAVIPQGDESELSRQIVELLEDPIRARAFAERAWSVGRVHFDLRSITASLDRVYLNALEKSK